MYVILVEIFSKVYGFRDFRVRQHCPGASLFVLLIASLRTERSG